MCHRKIFSLCLKIFPCAKAKFPVFSLSGKSKNQIPCFPCAIATVIYWSVLRPSLSFIGQSQTKLVINWSVSDQDCYLLVSLRPSLSFIGQSQTEIVIYWSVSDQACHLLVSLRPRLSFIGQSQTKLVIYCSVSDQACHLLLSLRPSLSFIAQSQDQACHLLLSLRPSLSFIAQSQTKLTWILLEIFSKRNHSLSVNVNTTVPMKIKVSSNSAKANAKVKLSLMFATTLERECSIFDSKDALSLSLLHCLVVNSSTLSSINSHYYISERLWQMFEITLQIYAVSLLYF